jgi:hypothetical protein
LSFKFDYRVLNGRKGIKMICRIETLDDQERHLTLEIPISEMAHDRRERDNTPAKQYQDKA